MTNLICITCPIGCNISAELVNGQLNCTGHTCARGEDFARAELTNPMRTLCSTVRTNNPACPLLPVRTQREIPKAAMMDVMHLLAGVTVTQPMQCGDVITSLYPICDGNVITTCDFPF
jgi:CxxC motif-containing protein